MKSLARKGSDIDLTLYGELSTAELFHIGNELDELMSPYQIDLSVFHQTQSSLSDSPIINLDSSLRWNDEGERLWRA